MESPRVHLLNTSPVIAGHNPLGICLAGQLATAPAGKDYGLDSTSARSLYGVKQVLGIATGSEEDQNIARLGESLHLTGEDLVETEVVANAGKRGGIGAQTEGRKGPSIVPVPAYQFLTQMEGITGAPAITSRHDLAT